MINQYRIGDSQVHRFMLPCKSTIVRLVGNFSVYLLQAHPEQSSRKIGSLKFLIGSLQPVPLWALVQTSASQAGAWLEL